ncbi:ABC transporter permease [uncultured Tyzzerella sp.]|uniref:ABC transporter permease n=1 Tax=uncultured Tyzzerella sp. TaxID=2321398 RepID=UPI002943CE3E|nr:ABC transporter permease [uncultured Tyzzerella sp.]
MRKNKLLTIFSMLVFLFLFIPLIIIVVTAFGEETTITFPIKSFSLKWFSSVLESQSFMSSFLISIVIALFATLLALLVGIPASYAISRYSFKGKNFLKGFFLSPTIIPGIVVGFSLFQFMVIKLRIPVFYGLLLGHFLTVLPYIIRVVGSSLEQFDFSIEEASWSLGCNKFKSFFKVVLPNITSGISSAFLLAFINSFNNIPISMFLSGPGVTTFPISLMNYIEYNYTPTVSAASVLLMLVTIIIMFIVEKTLGISALSK